MRREDARFYDEAVEALPGASGREAIARYIDVAVRQQLARPRLARLLDIEETRPEIQRALDGSKNMRTLFIDVLSRDDMPRQERPEVAVMDLGAIVRGLTDGAGERGERDLVDLARRITAAVFGYLEGMRVNGRGGNASEKSRPVVKRS